MKRGLWIWVIILAAQVQVCAQGNWLMVFSKGTEFGGQSYQMKDLFPLNQLEDFYYEGFKITDLSFNNGQWSMIFSKNANVTQQEVKIGTAFPESYINELKDYGYAITELAHDGVNWAIVLSKGSGIKSQQWLVNRTVPREALFHKYANGFRVTNITYTRGQWIYLLSKSKQKIDQVIHTDAIFPIEYCNERFKEGYRLTELARGEYEWILVFDKSTDYKQQVISFRKYPENEYLADMQLKGYKMTHLVNSIEEIDDDLVTLISPSGNNASSFSSLIPKNEGQLGSSSTSSIPSADRIPSMPTLSSFDKIILKNEPDITVLENDGSNNTANLDLEDCERYKKAILARNKELEEQLDEKDNEILSLKYQVPSYSMDNDIKELSQQNNLLKAKIAELESDLEKLKDRKKSDLASSGGSGNIFNEKQLLIELNDAKSKLKLAQEKNAEFEKQLKSIQKGQMAVNSAPIEGFQQQIWGLTEKIDQARGKMDSGKHEQLESQLTSIQLFYDIAKRRITELRTQFDSFYIGEYIPTRPGEILNKNKMAYTEDLDKGSNETYLDGGNPAVEVDTAPNCERPLTANSFNKIKELIASNKDENAKLLMSKQLVSSTCYYSEQVKQLVELFVVEQNKLAFAKFAFQYTFDPSNYYILNGSFYNMSSKHELQAYINSL